MSLVTTYFPRVPVGGATNYKLRPVLTYIVMVIWKCTDVFRGIFRLGGLRRGGYVGRTFFEELVMGKKIFMKGAQGNF